MPRAPICRPPPCPTLESIPEVYRRPRAGLRRHARVRRSQHAGRSRRDRGGPPGEPILSARRAGAHPAGPWRPHGPRPIKSRPRPWGARSGAPRPPGRRPDTRPDTRPDARLDMRPDARLDTRPDARPDTRPDAEASQSMPDQPTPGFGPRNPHHFRGSGVLHRRGNIRQIPIPSGGRRSSGGTGRFVR